MEDEYTLLVRVVGPFFGFLAALYFANPFLANDHASKLELEKLWKNFEKLKAN